MDAGGRVVDIAAQKASTSATRLARGMTAFVETGNMSGIQWIWPPLLSYTAISPGDRPPAVV
jgi:hypothetical protein